MESNYPIKVFYTLIATFIDMLKTIDAINKVINCISD